MDEKQRKKELRRKAGFFALRSLSWVSYLPLGLLYAIGSLLGDLTFLLLASHRKNALSSLATAFPEMPEEERRKTARSYFRFMVQGIFETLYFTYRWMDSTGISIQGKEHIDQALTRNKGVIAVTAHLGNFPLMCYFLSKRGYRVNIVMRPMRDAYAGRYFEDLRRRSGINIIYSYPRKECVSAILNALRRNEIVVILMDQNFGTGGVWVRFFGKLAATPVGPFILSRRSGAALVPLYMPMVSAGRHCIRILPEFIPETAEDERQALLFNAVRMTRIIEDWIRQTPWQWPWIHRRWKSRPSEKVKQQKYKVEGL